MSEFVTAWQINDKSRPELFERYLFVLRPQVLDDDGSLSNDAWAGNVNAILRRVDSLDINTARMDERLCALEKEIDTKFARVLQALDRLTAIE